MQTVETWGRPKCSHGLEQAVRVLFDKLPNGTIRAGLVENHRYGVQGLVGYTSKADELLGSQFLRLGMR